MNDDTVAKSDDQGHADAWFLRVYPPELPGLGNRSCALYQALPDRLSPPEVNEYFEHLVTERKLAPASCRLYFHGIRFLYVQVLEWPPSALSIALPKRPQRIPQLLTHAEVGRILGAGENPRNRMLLTLCYGCGLRVRELVAVKVSQIDGERRLLRVEQGKGAKDRLVTISETLLEQLRTYWRLHRPQDWLFPGRGWA